MLGVGFGLHLCPLLACVIDADVNALPLAISTVALLHVTLRVPGRVRITQLCQATSTELADQSESFQETTIALEERNRMLAAIEQIRTEITATIDLEEIIDTLSLQIVEYGIIRSLMVGVIDQRNSQVEVATTIKRRADGLPIEKQTAR